jgi:exosortase
LFPQTFASFIDKWSKFDESLGHGFLIVGIVVFEIFKSFRTYQPVREKNNTALLIVIFLLTILHEISGFWGILIFQQFSVYMIWGLAIFYILGFKSLKKIAFPYLYFLFAVPFWEFSNTFFVDLTTFAVTILLSFSDLIVFIHDNFIETPFGVIEVAEGCSGIRYFEIGLALAVYAVHSERLSWKLKLLVIIFGAIMGIITNWIRVLGLIYIGYSSEMKSPLMAEHDNYGFLLFFIVISSVIFLTNWLAKRFSLPEEKTSEENNIKSKVNYINLTLKLAAVLATIALTSYISNNNLNAILDNNFQDNPHNELKFNILNDFGRFEENSTRYRFQDQNCLYISRSYNFITSGENVLPYGQVYNQELYYNSHQKSPSIEYLKENIDVIHLALTNKQNATKSNLYYWYEYNKFYTTNKYVAKLFEISYLLQTKQKMKLNIIWCSQ